MFWRDSLIDVRQYPRGGSDLYVRVAHSVLDEQGDLKVIIIVPVIAGLAAISICILASWFWRTKRKGTRRKHIKQAYLSNSSEMVLKDDIIEVSLDDLPLYSFETIAKATDNFDMANLLGKGGFGLVYKLPDGNEVAVKRLSKESGQGLHEFMNEVVVISKLQHRNLVSLVGCSVGREEKMLIYELMANGSLDVLLFVDIYMAPEYAMRGVFSEKTDVFSFGVLVLEIINGRRNTSFYDDDMALSLLEYAWRLWSEGNFVEFIDTRIYSPSFQAEIIRCMNIGLLCVQEVPDKRPTMSTVLSMLGTEIALPPLPEQPAFTKKPTTSTSSSSQSHMTSGSLNNVTVTVLQGR